MPEKWERKSIKAGAVRKYRELESIRNKEIYKRILFVPLKLFFMATSGMFRIRPQSVSKKWGRVNEHSRYNFLGKKQKEEKDWLSR